MCTLNQENIIAPYTFKINGADFTITKFLNINPAQLAAVSFADQFC